MSLKDKDWELAQSLIQKEVKVAIKSRKSSSYAALFDGQQGTVRNADCGEYDYEDVIVLVVIPNKPYTPQEVWVYVGDVEVVE